MKQKLHILCRCFIASLYSGGDGGGGWCTRVARIRCDEKRKECSAVFDKNDWNAWKWEKCMYKEGGEHERKRTE